MEPALQAAKSSQGLIMNGPCVSIVSLLYTVNSINSCDGCARKLSCE